MILDTLPCLFEVPEFGTGKTPKQTYMGYFNSSRSDYFEMRMIFGKFEIVLHGFSKDSDCPGIVLRTVKTSWSYAYDGLAIPWDDLAEKSEDWFCELLISNVLAS